MLNNGNEFIVRQSDVTNLHRPEALAMFFQKLGYPGVIASPQNDLAKGQSLLHSASAKDQIRAFYQLARFQDADFGSEFLIYAIVVNTITAVLRKDIFQSLVNLGGADFLLVLSDTEEKTLDFVFLDRGGVARQGLLAGMGMGLMPGTVPGKANGARLRSHAFQRLNLAWPDEKNQRITLRVLNALAWQQNRDLPTNCQRLSAAFDIAEWSEEFFNNRSLFSDHFLLSLEDDREEAWQNALLPLPGEALSSPKQFERAFETLRVRYDDARETLSKATGAVCRATLIQPTLEALGFSVQPGARAEDYTLVLPDSRRRPGERAAICLAYAWNRHLDSYEPEESANGVPFDRPEENPGAAVVAQLNETGAEWAILTNGRLWRLYSAQAHSRATNYYEIDLEEILTIPRAQIGEAKRGLRYFWAIFRAQAFLRRSDYKPYHGQSLSFLEYLTRQSVDRALELGKNLKTRVFNEIFPYFAQGFVADAQRRDLLPALQMLSEQEEAEVLQAYFDGTLTFLFRLLFVLYAESRDLLPTHDRSAYYEHSLTALKHCPDATSGVAGQLAWPVGRRG